MHRRLWLITPTLMLLMTFTARSAVFTADDLQVSYDFTGYAATGFAPNPSVGQLDSDDVIVTGLSEGSLTFGGTETTGDYAGGKKNTPVNSGGVYSFDVLEGSGKNRALGGQPTGGDFTPGSFVFKLDNNTANNIIQIDIAFKIYFRNDQDAATRVTWEDSLDGITFTQIGSDSATSVAAVGANTAWILDTDTSFAVNFNANELADGSFYYFRFLINDAGGSGNWDEFAIDDVSFTASVAAAPEPASFITVVLGAVMLLRRRRAH